MRILIVHPMPVTYPSYKYINDMVIELTYHGDQVTVIGPHDGQTKLINGQAPAFELIDQKFDGYLLARDVKQQISAFDPDIIHVWNPRERTARIALESVIATGAKLVVNYEDPEHFHFDTLNGPVKAAHILKHVDKDSLSANDLQAFLSGLNWQWIIENFSNPDRNGFIHPLFFAALNHMASGFSAIWHPWQSKLSSTFHKPTLLMPYSVNFNKYPDKEKPTGSVRKKFNIPDNAAVFLRSGVIYHMLNDQPVLFEGFAEHLKSHPNSVLVICGKDETPERTDKYIRHFKLEESVIKTGFIKEQDYRDLLQTADAVLCPGYPDEYNHYRLAMKIIEYMVMGKAMICYASGIGRDLEDGSDALLLKEYTPELLAQHMHQLAVNPELRNKLGANARKRAMQWFDVRKLGPQVHEFYNNILHPPENSGVQQTEHEEWDNNALPRALLEKFPAILEAGIKKIALYGAGKHTQRLLDLTDLAPASIECIVDDSPACMDINGIPVITPDKLDAYNVDAILISSDSAEAILLSKAEQWMTPGLKLLTLYQAQQAVPQI